MVELTVVLFFDLVVFLSDTVSQISVMNLTKACTLMLSPRHLISDESVSFQISKYHLFHSKQQFRVMTYLVPDAMVLFVFFPRNFV